jgi:hypothetical protein
MAYKVQLAYFRSTGKFLAYADCVVEQETLAQIWDEIHELRSIGRLPGLRPNAGKDLLILVDVTEHPLREMHLLIPPFVNEDDITPVRVPTGEMSPFARTSTRDVVKTTAHDDEITPTDAPLPDPLPDPGDDEP